MARLTRLQIMSEEEYLEAEENAQVRHEYVDGYVFSMTGSTEAHNVICGNIFAFLHSHLLGGPCRPFMNDMKVRIESVKSYYYPDIMVTCESFDAKSVFKENPVLLIEVLSPSTASTDRREKLIAYQKIAGLKEYILVHQNQQQVELYRKGADGNWEFMVLVEEDLVLESLPRGPAHLSFEIIYRGYSPPMRVKEEASPYSW